MWHNIIKEFGDTEVEKTDFVLVYKKLENKFSNLGDIYDQIRCVDDKPYEGSCPANSLAIALSLLFFYQDLNLIFS